MSERTPQGLGFEMVVLGAAGIAVSAGGAIWAGAAISAALSGGRLTAGLGEAITALPRLPEEWLDPRQAWPAEHRPALPGPVLYWLSTFVVAAVVVAGLLAVLRFWRASRERGRVRLGVDTQARFATVRDLAPLVVDRPTPSARFVLGRVHGKLVATEDRSATPTARGRVAQRRGAKAAS